MICTNAEDFKNNMEQYLNEAIKEMPHDNIFLEYGNETFIITTEEMLSRQFMASVETGKRRQMRIIKELLEQYE